MPECISQPTSNPSAGTPAEEKSILRFFGGPAVLLLPAAAFVAFTIHLFIFEQAFDLYGLALAGFLMLFAGSIIARDRRAYWKAAVSGVAGEMSATVVLLLLAAGVFSAMMKAGGVAEGLVHLGSTFEFTGPVFTIFVLLGTSVLAAATGSSIGSLLAAMPIFFPVGTAIGVDPNLLAGAILSGAIFGDNLAPVSDVTIISCLTQRFRDGRTTDVGAVVRSRLPYALTALAIAVVFYAVTGSGSTTTAPTGTGDAAGLYMLIPVVVLIAVAVVTKDVLQAVTAGILVGAVTGLATGALTPEAVFSAEGGKITGFIHDGIENVAPIILLCLTLFAYTHLITRAGVPEALERAAKRRLGHEPSEGAFEGVLAATTLVTTTLFAAVTSASVAMVGALTDTLSRGSGVHPHRRANLLSGFANSLPVLMPFSAFILITLAATAAFDKGASVTPYSLMTTTFYPVALFIVFSVSIATGIGRKRDALGMPDTAPETRHE